MKVKFKKFSLLGRVPTKTTRVSACYVSSSRDVRLRPGATKKVQLDIGFKFLKRYACRAYLRSSMSVLPTFGGGVIDSDYRGNIGIILTNFAAYDVDIKIGKRITQIMFSEA